MKGIRHVKLRKSYISIGPKQHLLRWFEVMAYTSRNITLQCQKHSLVFSKARPWAKADCNKCHWNQGSWQLAVTGMVQRLEGFTILAPKDRALSGDLFLLRAKNFLSEGERSNLCSPDSDSYGGFLLLNDWLLSGVYARNCSQLCLHLAFTTLPMPLPLPHIHATHPSG